MATIRAYTIIKQSRKLAAILPLESADMFLAMNGILPVMSKYIDNGLVTADETAIPCWSLTALLDVLPLEIETHKQTDGYKTYYYVELYMKRMGKEIYLSTERHENLVDACVAMIEKLHELKML